MADRITDEGRGAGSTATSARRTVLFVDDEPAILSSLRRSLRAPDVDVLTAASGQEALETMARSTVHVIVSDMRMPGMNGAELLQQVLDRWPGTVRMLLTGHAEEDAVREAFDQARIHRMMHKPWDDGELRRTVREALGAGRELAAPAERSGPARAD